jgi:hypothetical protein
MPELELQKDAMDVLDAWLADYNGRARPAIPLGAKGEAGGAQLRLTYRLPDGTASILHIVAVERDGRPVMLVKRFEGPGAEAATAAGLWASTQLGRRPAS